MYCFVISGTRFSSRSMALNVERQKNGHASCRKDRAHSGASWAYPHELPVLVGVLWVSRSHPFEAKCEGGGSGALHAALDIKIALNKHILRSSMRQWAPSARTQQTLLLVRNNGRSRGEQIWIVLVRERSEGYGVAGALLTHDYFDEYGSKVVFRWRQLEFRNLAGRAVVPACLVDFPSDLSRVRPVIWARLPGSSIRNTSVPPTNACPLIEV